MAKAVQKIKLSPSRDIPFNKLVLSQSNVRRIKAGISIEDLAEDIAHRGKLLQSLYVLPIVDADGQETGMFEVPAGGRRYRALELLVKQKRAGLGLDVNSEGLTRQRLVGRGADALQLDVAAERQEGALVDEVERTRGRGRGRRAAHEL